MMQCNNNALVTIPSNDTAIKVENVWKTFEKGHPILRGFNMTVHKGQIYALLGSSGCGKTTILSCVVGRQSWDDGGISVLGSSPVFERRSVEPRKIGYMPQDLALQPSLTIAELVTLYGRIYGMSSVNISERLKFLQTFLQLPTEHILITDLSGGQKRRASMAITLLHEPDLIILDEPTVGLDPLLRQSIWEHLNDLVSKFQVTVVLTTHYIDEARRSSQIGLMRNGRIIAEESPKVLMEQYATSSLDAIVLNLCKQDSAGKKARSQISGQRGLSDVHVQPDRKHKPVFQGKLAKMNGERQIMEDEDSNVVTFLKYRHSVANGDGLQDLHQYSPTSTAKKYLGKCSTSSISTCRRLKGLIWAVFLSLFRHPAFIWLTFVLPIFSTTMVQVIFGSDLYGLKIGVVNNDDIFSNFSFVHQDIKAKCLDSKFSEVFLKKVSTEALDLKPFASVSEARKAVDAGDIWGYINIPFNYTGNMQQRMLTRQFSTNETIEGTIISLHLDMSNYIGSVLILKKLYEAYEAFIHELATSCGFPSKELDIPMRYDPPVYGEADGGSYAHHVVPGLVLLLIFVLPMGGCSVAVIQEKNQGNLDRMKVAGMASWDIIITYFVTHGCMQISQVTITTLVLVFGFSYEIKGSVLLYILISLSNAFAGLGFGFLLGLVCANELHTIIVVFASVSFLLPFSGTFWPIEMLSVGWRRFSYVLPLTLIAQSFRSVMFRGISLTHSLVWPGIAVQLAWMSVAVIISIIILRRY